MTAPVPPRVLLTGAFGGVGRRLRPLLLRRYGALRLSDAIDPDAPLAPGESFERAELSDAAAVARAVEGMDAIVHLGGQSLEAPWETILRANVIGLNVLYEAARVAGVRRIVFASSNHAVGFHRRDRTIDHRAQPRPDSRYGVSKVFGEALGALYADKHGIGVLNIRIGNVADAPADRRRLAIWISPEDLMQLVAIGIEHPSLRYEIVYGASDNARSWWDNRRARELGYRPAGRAEDHAARILAADEPVDPIGDRFQGGGFCSLEFDNDPSRAGPDDD
jgi:uronate dehydrogenase